MILIVNLNQVENFETQIQETSQVQDPRLWGYYIDEDKRLWGDYTNDEEDEEDEEDEDYGGLFTETIVLNRANSLEEVADEDAETTRNLLHLLDVETSSIFANLLSENTNELSTDVVKAFNKMGSCIPSECFSSDVKDHLLGMTGKKNWNTSKNFLKSILSEVKTF